MSDLVFKVDGNTVYTPLQVGGVAVDVIVTNMGDDTLDELGFYLASATSLGEVDHPADYPPHTDYQDLLTWGSQTDSGATTQGGVKLTVPQDGGSSWSGYLTRNRGSRWSDRVRLVTLAPGESATFTVKFEAPGGAAARRFYVDLRLE